jgi:hypothetical protein
MAEEVQGNPACLSPPAVMPFGSTQMVGKPAFDSAVAMPLRRAVPPAEKDSLAQAVSLANRSLTKSQSITLNHAAT